MDRYFLYQNIPHYHHALNLSISLGEFISTLVLAITAAILCWQAWETRKSAKFLEYQARPTGYFLLYKSLMYVKNTSHFLVKFYFRMSFAGSVLEDDYWQNPLYIYPGAGYMRFPNAFSTEKLVTGQIKIEYRIVPSHINDPQLQKDVQVIEWTYDRVTQKWTGPNGMPEEGIYGFLLPT